MNLTVRIPDELAHRIAATGVDPEQLALTALRQAVDELARASQPAAEASGGEEQVLRAAARAAGARIRQNRVGNTLPPGMTIRELIDYGRD